MGRDGVVAPEVEAEEVVEVQGSFLPIFVGGGVAEDGEPEGGGGVGVVPGYDPLCCSVSIITRCVTRRKQKTYAVPEEEDVDDGAPDGEQDRRPAHLWLTSGKVSGGRETLALNAVLQWPRVGHVCSSWRVASSDWACWRVMVPLPSSYFPSRANEDGREHPFGSRVMTCENRPVHPTLSSFPLHGVASGLALAAYCVDFKSLD